MEYVVVEMSSQFGWVYDFCTKETSAQVLEQANEWKEQAVAKYQELFEKAERYDQRKYWERQLKSAKTYRFDVMTYEQYQQHKIDVLIKEPVTEITEEKFLEMFYCLPPFKWCTIDGVEMFCMTEMLEGTITMQYAKKDDKYYSCLVDVSKQETWIHKKLNTK